MLRLLLIALAVSPLPRFDLHGDPLPPGAVARLGTARYRIGGAEVSALSPDGRTFAVADRAGVTLWDVATGRPTGHIAAPPSCYAVGLAHARDLAYSPDGKALVCHTQDVMYVLDPAARRVRWDQVIKRDCRVLGFSPDGKHMFLTGHREDEILVLERATGLPVEFRPMEGRVERASPSGRFLIGRECVPDRRTDSWADQIRVFDAGTGRRRATAVLPREYWQLLADQPPDGDWAVSPDDRRVWCLNRLGRLLSFDVATGRLVEDVSPPKEWDPTDDFRARLVLSPDGAVAYLSRRDDPVCRWDVKAKTWLPALPAMPDGRLVPHPDDKQVLHIGDDGRLRRYDLSTRREIPPPPGFTGGGAVRSSPDGRRIAVTSLARGGGLAVFETTGRLMWAAPTAKAEQLFWSPDGQQLAGVTDEEIVIREAAGGAEVRRLVTPADPRRGGCVGFGVVGKEGLRGLREREEFALAGVGGRLADRAGALFRLTQDRIDAGWGEGDYSLRRWAVHPFESPDGAFLLTWDDNGLAVLRDPRTGDRVGGFEVGHTLVHHYAFSPNGLWLAVTCQETVSLWDVPTGTCLVTWKAPDHINSVTFAGPGKLVTGQDDETALVWSLKPRRKPVAPPWEAIIGPDPHDACRAVWALADDPGGPALLRKQFAPAVPLPAAGRWIKDLDAGRYVVREKATAELAALGRSAAGAMRTALDGKPSAEARMRLEGLVAGLPTYRQHMEIAHARAVLAMELAGTPAARDVLRGWASGDPGATLTIDAKAALQRLGP